MKRAHRAAAIRAQFLEGERKGEKPHCDCPRCAEAFLYANLADTERDYLEELADPATGRHRSQELKRIIAELAGAFNLLEADAAPGLH
jgi:hypothetical protein